MALPRNDLEAVVASAWLAVTGQRLGSVFDDFFLTGGSSVQAAALAGLLCRRLDREVPLKLVFERPTVAALAAALTPSGTGAPHRYAYRLNDGSGVPLVLAPSAAGTSGWISSVIDDRSDRAVVGLSSRGTAAETPPLTDMDSIAHHLLAALTDAGVRGPAHFLGSCLGGRFALALAARAEEHGITAASLTMINTAFRTPTASYEDRVRLRLDDIRERAGIRGADRAPTDADVTAEVARLFHEVSDVQAVAENTLREFVGRVEVFAANWGAAMNEGPEQVDLPVHLLYNPQDAAEVDRDAWADLLGNRLTAVAIADLTNATVGRPDVVAQIGRFLYRAESARTQSDVGRAHAG